jgi:hypothetical protein
LRLEHELRCLVLDGQEWRKMGHVEHRGDPDRALGDGVRDQRDGDDARGSAQEHADHDYCGDARNPLTS